MNDDQTVTERALKSIIEASPLAIFDLDPRGKVNSIWNQAAEEIFGWTREEVLGQKLPIVPGEKQDEFDQLRERVLAGDSFTSLEARRQRKDGSFLTASISTAPLYDERGKVIGVMAIVDDVTGQERLERSLKKSEKKFREIFNNVNDAIYLHEMTEEGLPGPFIEVNDVASEMLGYSKEEFLSMSPQNIDSGEKSSELPKIMEDLLSKGQKTFDMTHQAKDGTEIPVEVSSHLFELDEEPRVLSIARDITGRKRAQRKLQQQRDRLERAMEAGNLAWWTMELPSGKVNFNERKATMLGWKPKQFNHYTDFTELIHSEDHEKAMKVMKDHLEGKKERYEV
ncbi:MAG: PAS domain-containing protein, partial [Candidatus Bipolaricaulota bacterium]